MMDLASESKKAKQKTVGKGGHEASSPTLARVSKPPQDEDEVGDRAQTKSRTREAAEDAPAVQGTPGNDVGIDSVIVAMAEPATSSNTKPCKSTTPITNLLMFGDDDHRGSPGAACANSKGKAIDEALAKAKPLKQTKKERKTAEKAAALRATLEAAEAEERLQVEEIVADLEDGQLDEADI